MVTKSYPDGRIYDGEMKNKLPHGYGKMIYFDGSIYIGNWREGAQHGQGRMLYATGDTYEGNWENDAPHGQGIAKFVNGNIYEGESYHGITQGYGKMSFANGDIYEGEWVDEEPHGQGTMLYADGNTYEGMWEHNNMVNGHIISYNGNEYEGDVLGGLPHGYGKLIFADTNDVYEGDFMEGVRHGWGIMSHSDGSRYEGEWENDVAVRGTLTHPNRRIEQIVQQMQAENIGMAGEIHEAADMIDLEQYFNIIDTPPVHKDLPIGDYIVTKFTEFIRTNVKEDEQEQLIRRLTAVINKLKQAEEHYNDLTTRRIMNQTIDFVLQQPKEFIEFYIRAFIKDCYEAYSAAEGQGLSCVKGIVERFYMIVGDAALAMCTTDFGCESDTYKQLLALFKKKAFDINAVAQKWNTDAPELQQMSAPERKQHFINFVKQEYVSLGNILDDPAIESINKYADGIEYVFETLQFGGKKERREKRKERKTRKVIKNKKKTRKYNKRNTRRYKKLK